MLLQKRVLQLSRFTVRKMNATTDDLFYAVVDNAVSEVLPEGHWRSAGCWMYREEAVVLMASLNYTHEVLMKEVQ
jgi:hypothetical protein